MMKSLARAAVAAGLLALAGAAQAQDAPRPGGFLGGLFGGDESSPRAAQPVQNSDSEVLVRLDRLENQIRQLTGSVEQLQYHNQQLEQALQRMQGNPDPRIQQSGTGSTTPRPTMQQPVSAPGRSSVAPAAGPQYSERQSDVFNPALHPDAPGAPRALGTQVIAAPEPSGPGPDLGAPGGRQPGTPLDLATLSARAASSTGVTPNGGIGPSVISSGDGEASLPPPPPRNTSATGLATAVQPPTRSPKDEYDLAYGYLLRKDYALAEGAFKTFLHDHPSDRLAADAAYWLGESRFQRQRYRDAAESFLSVTTKNENSAKAPDALYRLGQSLAAIGEKEAACAALGEVGRKYPRASSSVKQGVAREQKRVHC